MAKQKNRTNNRQSRRSTPGHEDGEEMTFYSRPRIDRSPIKAKNRNQERYINAITDKTLTFATGPAGTGKTWVVTAMAVEALLSGDKEKLIITRPAVEAGEEMGFLPGEINEKFDPYLQPFKDVLNERLGRSHVEGMIKSGKIEAAPLAYMRGRTFRDAFVILDEAQNTTPTQMKMFLTRIGANCTVVVNGDINQKDIKGESGLRDAVRRLSYIPAVAHIEFRRDDIVRSGLVAEIVQAYDRPDHELREME